MTRVAMLAVSQDLIHDNRIRREAEGLAGLGLDVRVLAWTKSELPPDGAGLEYVRVTPPRIDLGPHRRRRAALTERYRTARARRSPAAAVWRLALTVAQLRERAASTGNRLAKLRLVGTKLRYWRAVRPLLAEHAPDVVHAHDLKTLYAGARYVARSGVPLVYDAHELELHTARIHTPLDRAVTWLFERHGIRRAAAVITVGDEIAAELARTYGIDTPAVIRNAPPQPPAPVEVSSLRERCGLSADDRVVAYVGGVDRLRGVFELAAALDALPSHYHLVVVGARQEAVDRDLRSAGGARLHLLPPVPGAEVPALLATADVSVIPYVGSCRSHDLCQPNKLFESVAAGVPLAVSARPSLRRFVTENGLGTVFDERDPRSIAAAIVGAVEQRPPAFDDPERLRELKARYSWEAQLPVLADVYRRVLTAATGTAPAVALPATPTTTRG